MVNQNSLAAIRVKEKNGRTLNCGTPDDDCPFTRRKSCDIALEIDSFEIFLNRQAFSANLITTPSSQNILTDLPSIAVVKSDNSPCSASHATVCISYNPQNSETWVIDPKDGATLCTARRVKYQYTPSSPEDICSWILDVRPSVTGSVVPLKVESSFGKFASILQEEWLGEITNPMNQEQLMQICTQQDYECIPVKYVNYDKLVDSTSVSIKLDDYFLSQDIIEVIYKKQPFTKTSLVRENNLWVPYMVKSERQFMVKEWEKSLKIRPFSGLLPFFKGKIYSNKIKSFESPQNILEYKQFDRNFLVRFHHIDQDFILFSETSNNSNIILKPIENYKNYNKGPDKKCKNWIYSEKKILNDFKLLAKIVQ
jgi:hypothetical protein